jgi:hypothetical protein
VQLSNGTQQSTLYSNHLALNGEMWKQKITFTGSQRERHAAIADSFRLHETDLSRYAKKMGSTSFVGFKKICSKRLISVRKKPVQSAIGTAMDDTPVLQEFITIIFSNSVVVLRNIKSGAKNRISTVYDRSKHR